MEKLPKTDVPQELLTQDEMLSNLCRVEECRVWRLKSAAIKQQFRRYKQTSFRRFSKSNFRLEKRENTLLKMIHNVSKSCCYTSLLLGERSVHCKMLILMSFKGCLVRAFCINYHLQVPTAIFPLWKLWLTKDDSTMSSLLKEFWMVPLISSAHNSTIWNELALRTKAVNVQLIILKPSVYWYELSYDIIERKKARLILDELPIANATQGAQPAPARSYYETDPLPTKKKKSRKTKTGKEVLP